MTKYVFPVNKLVKAILSKHTSIFEKRHQGLAFLAEVEWLYQSQKTLTPAEYTWKSRDVYSEDIRNARHDHPNTYSRVAYQNGFRTEKWYVEKVNVTTQSVSEEQSHALECISDIYVPTDELSDSELIKFIRQLNIIQNTEKYSVINKNII